LFASAQCIDTRAARGWQIDSNSLEISSYSNVLFELTATGSVLSSFDINVAPINVNKSLRLGLLAFLLFLGVQAFEVVEVRTVGFIKYISNLYNMLELLSLITFTVMSYSLAKLQLMGHSFEANTLFNTFGFYDNWRFMTDYIDLRNSAGGLFCIQTLKLSQYLILFFPKLGLAKSVLAKSGGDLLGFSIM
jgi:hypothetical protein